MSAVLLHALTLIWSQGLLAKLLCVLGLGTLSAIVVWTLVWVAAILYLLADIFLR